jgi:hypothetical protein
LKRNWIVSEWTHLNQFSSYIFLSMRRLSDFYVMICEDICMDGNLPLFWRRIFKGPSSNFPGFPQILSHSQKNPEPSPTRPVPSDLALVGKQGLVTHLWSWAAWLWSKAEPSPQLSKKAEQSGAEREFPEPIWKKEPSWMVQSRVQNSVEPSGADVCKTWDIITKIGINLMNMIPYFLGDF